RRGRSRARHRERTNHPLRRPRLPHLHRARRARRGGRGPVLSAVHPPRHPPAVLNHRLRPSSLSSSSSPCPHVRFSSSPSAPRSPLVSAPPLAASRRPCAAALTPRT